MLGWRARSLTGRSTALRGASMGGAVVGALVAVLLVLLLAAYAFPATLLDLMSMVIGFVVRQLDRVIDWLVDHLEGRLRVYADDTHDHSAAYWAGVADLASYLTALVALVGVVATFGAVVYGAR